MTNHQSRVLSPQSPVLSPAKRYHLDESQRAALEALIAEPRHRSAAQIARLFLARTGRQIGVATAERMCRKKRYTEGRPDSGNRHLSEADRNQLHLLIREGRPMGRPSISYPEIARQFEALTGRAICHQCVWQHATRVLGLTKLGKGKGPRVHRARADARIEAVSARKHQEEQQRREGRTP